MNAKAESDRLKEAHTAGKSWKKWGPDLSERQRGSVREQTLRQTSDIDFMKRSFGKLFDRSAPLPTGSSLEHTVLRFITLVLSVLLAHVAFAQLPGLTSHSAPPAQAAPQPAPQDPLGRDNPRGCFLGFLKAAEREDYEKASQYLDVRGSPAQTHELARQLKTLLNHGLSQNPEDLSRASEGDLTDGLRNNRDRAGFVETKSGRLDVLLDRIQRGNGPPIWLFSSETLRRVPDAFEQINKVGIEQFVPKVLRDIKLFSIPLWRWLGILLGFLIALLAAALVSRLLMLVLRMSFRHLQRDDQHYVLSLRRPLRLIMVALAIRCISLLGFSLLGRTLWNQVSNVVAIIGFTWLLIQLTDIASDLKTRNSGGQIAVIALTRRLFKVLLIFCAVLLLLKRAGVNVSAMLAGLGIGGIALALGAQKTLEDLFGGITIISRHALRVGDFCRVADQIGTIEDIGLSSTRVRTLDRTVVSISNAKLAQVNLENYSMRDKFWFHHTFGLAYSTSAGQLRSVLAKVREMLGGDSRIERESFRIRLIAFGPSSLTFEIFAYVEARNVETFLAIQEELLLRIMDLISDAGTSIALPSQVTYVDREQGNSEFASMSILNAGKPVGPPAAQNEIES